MLLLIGKDFRPSVCNIVISMDSICIIQVIAFLILLSSYIFGCIQENLIRELLVLEVSLTPGSFDFLWSYRFA